MGWEMCIRDRVDEHLFVLQQVKLVTIQRLFYRIDVTVHLIVGILLGDDITFSYRPSVTLFQVGRPSGYVQMMDGHGTFLCVDSRSQFLCGPEKETDASGVHILEQFFACIVAVCFLNELYLLFRDIMVFHELAPYLAVNVPLVRLISTKV